MALRLRRDTVFLKTSAGLYIRNDARSFHVKGKGTYELFVSMLPVLDRGGSIEDLLASTPQKHRDTAERLIFALRDRNALLEYESGDDLRLSANDSTHFASQIAFLSHLTTEPKRQFQHFRSRRIFIHGATRLDHEIGIMLLRNGVETLATSADSGPIFSDWNAVALGLAARGLRSSVRTQRVTGAADLQDLDLVICADETSALKHIATMHAWCQESKTTFLPAFLFNDKALVGPFVRPLRPPCWLCTIMRLAERWPSDISTALWRSLIFEVPRVTEFASNAVVIRMLAATIAQEIFKWFALDDAGMGSRLFVQDLATLESNSQRILRHPLCPCNHNSISETEESRESLSRDPVPATILERWSDLTGSDVGIVSQFLDDDLEQVPLRHSILTIASRAGTVYPVHGWSIESSEMARFDALRNALEFYSWQMAGSCSNLVNASILDLRNAGRVPILPNQFWHWLGNNPTFEEKTQYKWIAASDPASGDQVFVPLGAVTPWCNCASALWFDRECYSIGADATIDKAISRSILSLYKHMTLVEIFHRDKPLLRLKIDPESAICAMSDIAFYLSTLGTMKLEVQTFVATYEKEGVTVVLASTDTASNLQIRGLAVGAGFSLAEAFADALKLLVADQQNSSLEGNFPARFPSFIPKDSFLQVEESLPTAPHLSGEGVRLTGVSKRGRRLLTLDITPADVQLTASLLVYKALFISDSRSGSRKES